MSENHPQIQANCLFITLQVYFDSHSPHYFYASAFEMQIESTTDMNQNRKAEYAICNKKINLIFFP